MILDGVYNNVRDPEGFEVEAVQGFEMGFDGKTLVHPTQIEPTNSIWAPSDDEIEHARRVIEAFDAAQAEGKGVATVDGKMIENLHVDNAKRAPTRPPPPSPPSPKNTFDERSGVRPQTVRGEG